MLPPVILMQMLSSPHFESHFGWASELPEFLGNPKDFSEKSWYGIPWGPTGPPYRAPYFSCPAYRAPLYGRFL